MVDSAELVVSAQVKKDNVLPIVSPPCLWVVSKKTLAYMAKKSKKPHTGGLISG